VIDETNFAAHLPRVRLTTLPSPLQHASRLEDALREDGARPPRIYIKRDDLLGLAFGGNKIRNLEFTLGAAVAEGATDVITVGRAQSNHCRLTAAACARLGLRCHLVMSGDRPAASTGNLLLSELFGAACAFTGTDDRNVRESRARDIEREVSARGARAWLLPVGGSDARGALGHALAAIEIIAQCAAAGERPAAIVLATATGGTQAGLLLGLSAVGSKTRVVGYTVHKAADDARGDVLRVATDAATLLTAGAVDVRGIDIDDTQLGGGYGVPSRAGMDAASLLARTEGILLDPVYTAKAMAGLLATIRAGGFTPDDCIVFVHTGGAPALFAEMPATSM
jgi:D-cysteine desulfhydrase family pyridoxal phosphate-dependent enzyme